MGINFAPWNVSLERRLQTLSAAIFMIIFPLGGPICLLFVTYALLFTQFWWCCILYLSWMCLIDKNIEERGGRELQFMRSSSYWKYFRNYFPARLNRSPWVELKKDKNYLFCCFPHGIISISSFVMFGNIYGEFNDYFPEHKIKVCTLRQNFYMPFFRELILGLGGCSSSKASIEYLLNRPEGGNAVALIVGGVAESYYAEPREYKLVLKNRKGFVKIAIKSGSPLVPVLSFGETDIFNQYGGKNTRFKRFQEEIRKWIGIAPVLSYGRGLLQYDFGLIPHRRPITMLVGTPIEVERNEHPSSQEVDYYHQLFIKELISLFEKNKHLYLEDSQDLHIELV
ncbi:2-acylglycerol O-acyltransferase 2-like [Coccinella septempunctata]|uniref:2-acylglycerol O-acyltransferase 2-like n=1 Tax=Coccinella septempunctata TaxID=41139 RepID=UPI001D05EBE7|nr:2-acylglycerol O-acyltransferase 2-like [Coccinella septempunctata]